MHLVAEKLQKLQNVFYNWKWGLPRDATFLDTGLAKKSRLYLEPGFPNLDTPREPHVRDRVTTTYSTRARFSADAGASGFGMVSLSGPSASRSRVRLFTAAEERVERAPLDVGTTPRRTTL